MYTPLNDYEFIFKFFFGKEVILSLKLHVRLKSIPRETLQESKTLNLLVIFSITQPLNSTFCWFLDRCHKNSDYLDVMGKMAFIFVFSRRKNTE